MLSAVACSRHLFAFGPLLGFATRSIDWTSTVKVSVNPAGFQTRVRCSAMMLRSKPVLAHGDANLDDKNEAGSCDPNSAARCLNKKTNNTFLAWGRFTNSALLAQVSSR